MGRPSKYPEEFRREAVALYRSSDRSRADVAKSLGISDGFTERTQRIVRYAG
jgi:transposase